MSINMVLCIFLLKTLENGTKWRVLILIRLILRLFLFLVS